MTHDLFALPDFEDKLNAPHWQGLRENRIRVQYCTVCRRPRWQPSPICPYCLQQGSDWKDVTGEGCLYSYTVYRRAMAREFAKETPYAVGLIELDDDLKMFGRLTTVDGLNIGDPVTATFRRITDKFTLLCWQPAIEGRTKQ